MMAKNGGARQGQRSRLAADAGASRVRYATGRAGRASRTEGAA